MSITGRELIAWGLEPGPWFKEVLPLINQMLNEGADEEFVRAYALEQQPAKPDYLELRKSEMTYPVFLDPKTTYEFHNLEGVVRHMDNITLLPTVQKVAVMPDACPTGGQLGTIPVGGVVATENAIHPGFHSADICCSMMMNKFPQSFDPARVLDAAMEVTHFGPGHRTNNNAKSNPWLQRLVDGFEDNMFLKGLEEVAYGHHMTQGDGNHFFFVGKLLRKTAIVTHHGSRKLGAELYKRGMACAKRMTRAIAPSVPDHQAWIPFDTDEGRQYWDALQIVRGWTKLNHQAIHDGVMRKLDTYSEFRIWNEHNFVFRRDDGLFYHAKGATPAFEGYADDDVGMTLIPLNMGQPILITSHRDKLTNEQALGFSPHGAGRNISRTQHMRNLTEKYGDDRGLSPDVIAQIVKDEAGDVDLRSWSGKVDLSELPSSYKNPNQIVKAIDRYNLATIVYKIEPQGTIMAGEQKGWKEIKADKAARKVKEAAE